MNDITERKLCGLLGLAAKAGKVQSGEFCTEKSLKTRRAKLCIVASDASEPTKKRFRDMCAFRQVPIYTDILEKDKLGHIIGRGMRASITVEDEGFAQSLISLLRGM